MLRLSRSNLDAGCKGTRNEGGANARLYVAETKTYFASLADFYSGTPMEKAFTERALFAQGTPTIQQEVLDKIRTIVNVTVRNQELLDRDGKLTLALSRVTSSTFISFVSVAIKESIKLRDEYKTAGIEHLWVYKNKEKTKGQNFLTNVRFLHNNVRSELHWNHLKADFAQRIGELKAPAAPTPQVAPQSATIVDLADDEVEHLNVKPAAANVEDLDVKPPPAKKAKKQMLLSDMLGRS